MVCGWTVVGGVGSSASCAGNQERIHLDLAVIKALFMMFDTTRCVLNENCQC